MNPNPHFTMKAARTSVNTTALRSAFAVVVVACALHSHSSSAVLVLANGTDEREWYVGAPIPSINVAPDLFVVRACGPELAWVYANFPTIATLATRTIDAAAATRKTAKTPETLPENTCALWRGDTARFIADNLANTGS